MEPYLEEHPEIEEYNILELVAEPERIIQFRVPWEDDEGNWRVNLAWRVQYNSTLGPHKGGIRFHPTVNESILRFLGFEQTFKNALTGLPLGGGVHADAIMDRIVHNAVWFDTGQLNMHEHQAIN